METVTKLSRVGQVSRRLYEKEYPLRLRIGELMHLEESRGCGCHTILNRMVTNDFHVMDVVEVIRLGLIGSGAMSPVESGEYVQKYMVNPKDLQGKSYIMDYYQAAQDALWVSLYGPNDNEISAGKLKTEANTSTPSVEQNGESSSRMQE